MKTIKQTALRKLATTMTNSTTWKNAPLVALDLEGTGAQDRDREAILEIALVPLNDGDPDLARAYATLINPGRPIPRSPWISPGLTNTTLAAAPTLDDIRPELTTRLNGKILVGHNIRVDARLLERHCPDLHIDGLIDTFKLARHLGGSTDYKLTTLLDRYQLTEQVHQLAQGSQPHRALWDTIAAALLLRALIDTLPGDHAPTFAELRRLAGHRDDSAHKQQFLLDL